MMDPATSWTDDIPVCHLSGLGLSTNQIYREDGNRREAHAFEDRNFHFRHDTCFLYGIFDGHNGTRVAEFAAQRIPAELLLGQLQPDFSDEKVKDTLKQAFIEVEKVYFGSMDALLAERTTLQDDLPQGIDHYTALQKYPETMKKLEALDKEISGGTTATVVLICNNKLYVSNVGDTRALLVKTCDQNTLRVIQLSYDHTINDPGEQTRLAQAGLDIEQMQALRRVANSDCTRCIGDYHVKGGYKDNDALSCARVEPVIADPFVDGGFELDSSAAFLLLMSDGLYQALMEATDTTTVNGEIATMVAQEFRQQTTLNGVAQAVVDRVVRIHHDTFMTGSAEKRQRCTKRDDITLLVRNFNYPLSVNSPGSLGGSPTAPHPSQHAGFPSPATVYNASNAKTSIISPQSVSAEDPMSHPDRRSGSESPATPTNTNNTTALLTGPPATNNTTSSLTSGGSATNTNTSSVMTGLTNNTYSTDTPTNDSSNYSTNSSGERQLFSQGQTRKNGLDLDAQGKVKAYVDFTEWDLALSKMTEEQRESLYKELLPESVYEPIQEEPSVDH